MTTNADRFQNADVDDASVHHNGGRELATTLSGFDRAVLFIGEVTREASICTIAARIRRCVWLR
jgi:hypothetical protein